MDVAKPSTAVSPGVDSDVFAVLANSTQPRTGREIARQSGRSQAGVQAVLDRLAEHGVVDRQEAGNSFLYTLNREHILSPIIEQMAGARTTLIDRLRESINSWEKPALHVSLFGSTARGDGDTESDIDLFIVRAKEVDPEDPAWSAQLEDLAALVRRWTGNHAAIAEIFEDEIARLADEQPPVVKEIKKDVVNLAGPSARDLLAR